MSYALEQKQDLIFSAKDTISKVYDRNFREIFKQVFMEEYMEQFRHAGLKYEYCLIDDAVSRVIKNSGGYVWACQNYDGDVMSDMLATAYGSAAMMTSVLVSPDGVYEYEAAHGTVRRHYYQYLEGGVASTNPLAYCEGGFYGGRLGLHDKIKPLLKTATASFGITAFNELQQLYNGKSLVEDGSFALEVLEHINEKVEEFKKADGNLYAIYATPAENLCGLQVKQFRKKYGIIENVSDREYVSNGFHCHVTEDISPIQKQNLEYRFWELSNGGKIQYVKYPIDYNLEAVRTLVRRAMEMGFYEGVNLSLSYCDDCGHSELDMDVCPACGSSNLTKIDRMNGYLSYSRVKGDTRLNEAKMAEIAERKSM